MECLIHLMALCVFDPSGVYMTGEVYAGKTRGAYEGYWCWKKQDYCQGPVGELRLGVEVPITPTVWMDYGWKHQSYLEESEDNGLNGFFLSITWRPFK